MARFPTRIPTSQSPEFATVMGFSKTGRVVTGPRYENHERVSFLGVYFLKNNNGIRVGRADSDMYI